MFLQARIQKKARSLRDRIANRTAPRHGRDLAFNASTTGPDGPDYGGFGSAEPSAAPDAAKKKPASRFLAKVVAKAKSLSPNKRKEGGHKRTKSGDTHEPDALGSSSTSPRPAPPLPESVQREIRLQDNPLQVTSPPQTLPSLL